jgi:hypothetical protein
LSGQNKTWVALVSGLSVGAQEAPADLKTQLLVEWLTGESGGPSVSRRLAGDSHDKGLPVYDESRLTSSGPAGGGAGGTFDTSRE